MDNEHKQYALRIIPIAPNLVNIVQGEDGSVTFIPKKSHKDLQSIVQLVETQPADDNCMELREVLDERRITLRPLLESRRKIQVSNE